MEEKIENEVVETEEIAEETTTKQDSNIITIEKPDESEESFDRTIERERQVLFTDYQKSRKISNIITIVVLLIGLGGVILITQKNLVMTIIGWSLMGATVVGMLIFYIVNKNKFPNKTREYIKTVTRLINEQTFKDKRFTDVKTNPEERFDVSEVIGDKVYSGLAQAQSRNVVHGKFDGQDFLYSEVALFKAQTSRKKEAPVFVGKYISTANKLEMKGRIILNIKRTESPLDLPTEIGDLTVLNETPNLAVYGLKETDAEKVLGKKFYNSFIKEFELKDHLVNVVLVVWAGKSAAYISYDDGAMGLPFDKPVDKNAYDQMSDNLAKAFELLTKIGK